MLKNIGYVGGMLHVTCRMLEVTSHLTSCQMLLVTQVTFDFMCQVKRDFTHVMFHLTPLTIYLTIYLTLIKFYVTHVTFSLTHVKFYLTYVTFHLIRITFNLTPLTFCMSHVTFHRHIQYSLTFNLTPKRFTLFTFTLSIFYVTLTTF